MQATVALAADAFRWSRDAAAPLMAAVGQLPKGQGGAPPVAVDPARAIATCLKPADEEAGGACILRLWEVAGQGGPVAVTLNGFRRAVQTDLLERDLKPLAIQGGRVTLDLRPFGFAAVRLVP